MYLILCASKYGYCFYMFLLDDFTFRGCGLIKNASGLEDRSQTRQSLLRLTDLT